jgi:hypothetical protein
MRLPYVDFDSNSSLFLPLSDCPRGGERLYFR